MMDIDEELSLQIKKVFNDLDDGRSDIGWSMLMEKYHQKPTRRFPLAWASGIAAMLAIAIGLWIFLSNQNKKETRKNELVKKTDLPQFKNNADGKSLEQKYGQLDSTYAAIPDQPQIATKILPPSDTDHSGKSLSDLNTASENLKKGILSAEVKKTLENPTINPIKGIVDNPILTNEGKDRSQAIAQMSTQKNKMDSLQNVIDKPKVVQQVTKVPDPGVTKITTEDFLLAESRAAANRNEKAAKEKKVGESKNSYEVFTGTFVNYFGDNDVKVNAGFGLNANLKVSKSLFLSVGAGISQNKITYRSYDPNISNGLLYSSSYAVSAGGSTNVLQPGFISNTKLNAQLLSLDLPITIKFYPTKKQNFYFATGFNSNTYFAQKYDYTYTVTSTSPLANNLKTEFGETEKSKFRGFDLANSAILAIGINQKIGKTNILIFEPYFKPAIGNMGEKNLRINTLGLNLKLSFGQDDKK